jgi:hypothetical protein
MKEAVARYGHSSMAIPLSSSVDAHGSPSVVQQQRLAGWWLLPPLPRHPRPFGLPSLFLSFYCHETSRRLNRRKDARPVALSLSLGLSPCGWTLLLRRAASACACWSYWPRCSGMATMLMATVRGTLPPLPPPLPPPRLPRPHPLVFSPPSFGVARLPSGPRASRHGAVPAAAAAVAMAE